MPDFGRSGPFAVAIDDGEWHDGSRDRTLRWRRYRPRDAGPHPVVVHSHGLGGSRASGADWLAHWASWGIAGIAVQHPGTDRDALASADSPLALRPLLRSAVDARQLALRQHDLMFAIDCIACENPPAIGISGHSYGAVSAMRLLGERRGLDDCPADTRIAAAVLFSPSARGGHRPLDERFSDIALPCLHLTGTRDDGIGPGDIRAADRCLPFTHGVAPDQYLLVLDEATHPELAGDGLAPPDRAHALRAVSCVFWLAHLRREPEATRHLREQCAATLETLGCWSLR